MSKEGPGRSGEKDEPEKKWDLKKEEYTQFIGKDLVQTYIYLRNYIPKDAKEKFEVRQNLVEVGRQLLPSDDKIKSEDKKDINELKKDVDNIIKKQPSAGNRIYDFITIGGQRVTCYHLTADEIKGRWTCLSDEYNKGSENFDKEQCKKLIPDLVKVDNKIFSLLVKYEVIKKEIKSPDEEIEDYIKLKFKDKIEQIEQNRQKSNKTIEKVRNAE